MLDRPVRHCVPVRVRFVADGIPLEPIPPGPYGHQEAMALVHRDWRAFYFLTRRETWTEDDYFRYAAKRQAELRIARP
jgi:hypothetical protein